MRAKENLRRQPEVHIQKISPAKGQMIQMLTTSLQHGAANHAEKTPDYRPLGYADPVPSAVMSREGRNHPWNAQEAKAVLTLNKGRQVAVSGMQLTVLLESLTKTYPFMKPRNVLRTLTMDELRAILIGTVAA